MEGVKKFIISDRSAKDGVLVNNRKINQQLGKINRYFIEVLKHLHFTRKETGERIELASFWNSIALSVFFVIFSLVSESVFGQEFGGGGAGGVSETRPSPCADVQCLTKKLGYKNLKVRHIDLFENGEPRLIDDNNVPIVPDAFQFYYDAKNDISFRVNLDKTMSEELSDLCEVGRTEILSRYENGRHKVTRTTTIGVPCTIRQHNAYYWGRQNQCRISFDMNGKQSKMYSMIYGGSVDNVLTDFIYKAKDADVDRLIEINPMDACYLAREQVRVLLDNAKYRAAQWENVSCLYGLLGKSTDVEGCIVKGVMATTVVYAGWQLLSAIGAATGSTTSVHPSSYAVQSFIVELLGMNEQERHVAFWWPAIRGFLLMLGSGAAGVTLEELWESIKDEEQPCPDPSVHETNNPTTTTTVPMCKRTG